MKLEVGMYVRTEWGISKIVNIFFEKTGIFIETDNGLGNCSMSTRGKLHKGIYILEEDYKTFIDNNVKNTIIGLIEVGDYVNGYKVYEVKEACVFVGYKCFATKFNDEEEYLYQTIYEKDIKSILAKEQYENMAYKVGE